MEDNTSSDDEVKNSASSPKLSGKKLKLNDGSSQDSVKEAATTSEKNENVDSGVSADKSESTSSDDPAVGAGEGPSNELVSIAPSGSNVRAILLNFRRPLGRNYRKRKTPDQDTDSNDSSRDSDDISAEEANAMSSRNSNHSNSNEDNDELFNGTPTFSFRRTSSWDSHSGTNSVEGNSSDSNDSYGSDDMMFNDTDDTDDTESWPRSGVDQEETDENKSKMPPVLLKSRPKHNYLMLREIINREMGLTFPYGKTTKNDVMFEQRFYSSLHTVYRMKRLHTLNKHKGCVNSINFHPEGHLLASGSDDTNVVVWDWARNKELQVIKTGHKSNVFQSKFLHLNAMSQLNIVTCARDGQVRLLQCPPSGGSSVVRRRLVSHSRAAHKLHVTGAEPHLVVSCGEDGLVMQCDVREEKATRLFQVREKSCNIPLYSVHGHPLDSKQMVVAGRDKFVRLYDRRKSVKPVSMYCPSSFTDNTATKRRISMHLTCAVYNHDGTEILGSYNDEDIYLFDAIHDAYDKEATDKEGFSHRYSGHRNSATFKGVSFFGPKSEYIVSGSDCSHVYIWEKETESIVQWLKGDVNGVVNCIETHPRCPVIATSGLDKDVKIWIPRANKDPDFFGLQTIVRENSAPLRSPLFNDFLPTLYSAWRSERLFADASGEEREPGEGHLEFDGNVCSLA